MYNGNYMNYYFLMTNLCKVRVHTTCAEALWSNGLVKHHNLIIVGQNPKLSKTVLSNKLQLFSKKDLTGAVYLSEDAVYYKRQADRCWCGPATVLLHQSQQH